MLCHTITTSLQNAHQKRGMMEIIGLLEGKGMQDTVTYKDLSPLLVALNFEFELEQWTGLDWFAPVLSHVVQSLSFAEVLPSLALSPWALSLSRFCTALAIGSDRLWKLRWHVLSWPCAQFQCMTRLVCVVITFCLRAVYMIVVHMMFTCCLLLVYFLFTFCLLLVYLLFTSCLLVVYLLFTFVLFLCFCSKILCFAWFCP